MIMHAPKHMLGNSQIAAHAIETYIAKTQRKLHTKHSPLGSAQDEPKSRRYKRIMPRIYPIATTLRPCFAKLLTTSDTIRGLSRSSFKPLPAQLKD